jgi:hypothetical protein
MTDFQQPVMDQAPAIRPMVNLGATLDIISGKYLFGRHGESILIGGAPPTVGVVGMPNAFKSAFIRFMSLTILARIKEASGATYDSESTVMEDRYRDLAAYVEGLEGQDIFDLGRWFITNSDMLPGEKWFDKLCDFLKARIENRKKGEKLLKTPFMDRDKVSNFKMLPPYIQELDSISEWSTTANQRMVDENEIGEGGQTLFMQQGLHKTRLMQELPRLAAAGHAFVFITAHLGKEIPMDPRSPPAKTLQYLKQGIKIKGAPPKFEYLTHLSWLANSAPPLVTKEKTPLYPRDSEDNMEGDTDLVCVTMTILSNKTGPSGLTTQVIYSQQEGLLPSLTEFHYIKEWDKFGIQGNDRNYQLELLPDVNLSRTTVRGKIDADPKLRRALNISAELCQMHNHWHHLGELLCTPKELYEDLRKLGYDWDVLLNTRGWWTTDDDHPLPFLSTMDLLRMRKGLYHPYWMEPLKKAA